MPIRPENTPTTERELVPEGNHVGILYRIINIGTIETPYLDKDGNKKHTPKVRLYWELPNELREYEKDGEMKQLPMSISREVTLSLYKSEKQTAVLRTITHALIGTSLKDEEAESYDIEDLLGRACMVEVSHERMDNGTEFAKAVGFGSIPKGMEVPAQTNKSRVDDVREMSQEEIEELPEWLRDKMKASREYHVRFLAPRGDTPQSAVDEIRNTEIKDEDVPF
jgi:hypothetical protein